MAELSGFLRSLLVLWQALGFILQRPSLSLLYVRAPALLGLRTELLKRSCQGGAKHLACVRPPQGTQAPMTTLGLRVLA